MLADFLASGVVQKSAGPSRLAVIKITKLMAGTSKLSSPRPAWLKLASWIEMIQPTWRLPGAECTLVPRLNSPYVPLIIYKYTLL